MSDRICYGEGGACPKCRAIMSRYRHPVGFVPKLGRGYFRYWDICSSCGHLQNYKKAKTKADVSEKGTPREDLFNEWYEGLADQEWWSNADRREAFVWAWSELYSRGLHPKHIMPILSRVVGAARMRR